MAAAQGWKRWTGGWGAHDKDDGFLDDAVTAEQRWGHDGTHICYGPFVIVYILFYFIFYLTDLSSSYFHSIPRGF